MDRNLVEVSNWEDVEVSRDHLGDFTSEDTISGWSTRATTGPRAVGRITVATTIATMIETE